VRLFVAIELADDITARLAQLSDELRRRVEQRAPAARLTWVPRERLHLTVRFIGEVNDSHAAAIRDRLAPPLDTAAFDMFFDGAGAFPPHGPPRVLWAGIAAGSAPLAALEREVTARLRECGIPPEKRPYRPHLTLARVRQAHGLGTGGLFDGLDGAIGTSPVAAITLFQSQLSPKGSRYLRLQSTNLRSSI
jgi:2'-5' RNA ligase